MQVSIRNYFLYVLVVLTLFSSCQREQGIFTSLPSSKTHISFRNDIKEKDGLSILYYLYFYNGGGVSIGDINNDSLPDIYFTANTKGNNKLYLNKGGFEFEDITPKAGVAGNSDWCSGSTMADVNGDGLLDIYVSSVSNKYGLKGRNELFINMGNGIFSEKAEQYGLDISCFTTQSVFFDYDRDGDLDCYILNQSHKPHSNIIDTSNRRKYDTLSGDRLYRNDIKQTGKFTDVSASAGIYQSALGYGLGIAVADINNDGWDDIYIGNDFHENDYYYINQQNGTFEEESAKHFKHYSRFSMGNDIADYDNDGELDLITVDMLPSEEKILKTYGSDENPDIYKVKLEMNGFQKQYSRNMLQHNNGNGTSFSETGLQSNVSATDWSWSPLFADFDNDGNKDLAITSGIVKRPVDMDYVNYISDMQRKKGLDLTDQFDQEAIDNMPDGSSHPYLFLGNGKSGFKDQSKSWGLESMKGYFTGSAYADLDNDGNLDLVINALNGPAVILKNNSVQKNHLSVSFKGDSLNSFGIGVKAWVFQSGRMQYQQLMLTRGFQSSSDTRIHFGLDSIKTIDSLLIVWPNQQYQIIKNPLPNKPLMVHQKDASGKFVQDQFFPKPSPLFTAIKSPLKPNWQHLENDFFDYNVQYLIPHAQSTHGPKMTVGDVNKDGLEDFYVCGASTHSGALMLQTKNGDFVKTTIAITDRIRMTEEVDALFFDANQDGWLDLYVVSGGNVFEDDNPVLADQLYLNNGKGSLVQTFNQLPKILSNKSCVRAADIDKDGDLDLFIGGLTAAKSYGLPQNSYLLLNNGKGIFSVAAKEIAALDKMGMVTTASFTDLNKDGWQDLVVTGEWMSIKIFINQHGIFKLQEIPASTGLWQTLESVDINADGFPDLLAGNWGHNSKLYAGKDGPLKLYVKDFDRNGSLEQIMCYTLAGKEYTFLAKDELERALPVLKKAYLKYGEVAGKTVDYMFYDLFKDYLELKAENLGSTCYINDGKGSFIKKELPEAIQMAPVFSFLNLDTTASSYLAAGNFYGTIPYEGRYDALLPTLFSFHAKTDKFHVGQTIPAIDGEIRDAKLVQQAGGKKLLILSRNNAEMLFFQKGN
jgi:hypothetical protein